MTSPLSSTTTDSPPRTSLPTTEMAPLSPSPLLSSSRLVSSNIKMAPPSPNKLKPDMKIPIPPQTTEQPTSTPSSSFSSESTTSSWPFSTPNSRSQTPLTSSFPLCSRLRPKPIIHRCRLPQRDKKGHPLDVLERTYYKPEEEIDIEEALEGPPLPGTFRYVVEREVRGECKKVAGNKLSSEAKKAEFERVKRELRLKFG